MLNFVIAEENNNEKLVVFNVFFYLCSISCSDICRLNRKVKEKDGKT
jgi:hypothetical protein